MVIIGGKMKATININTEAARNVLYMAAGSYEESEIIKNMSDEEIKNKVLQHCKCWGISEVKDENYR